MILNNTLSNLGLYIKEKQSLVALVSVVALMFASAVFTSPASAITWGGSDDATTKWVNESFDGSSIIGTNDVGNFFDIIITPIGTGLSWVWDNYGTEILVFLIAMGIVTVLFSYMRLGRARHRGMRIR